MSDNGNHTYTVHLMITAPTDYAAAWIARTMFKQQSRAITWHCTDADDWAEFVADENNPNGGCSRCGSDAANRMRTGIGSRLCWTCLGDEESVHPYPIDHVPHTARFAVGRVDGRRGPGGSE